MKMEMCGWFRSSDDGNDDDDDEHKQIINISDIN